MRGSFQVLLLGLALSFPALGADGGGNYYLAGGVGAVMCPHFVAAMERARSTGIGTVDFANATEGFAMYVLGFESGYNVAKSDTYDVFPSQNGVYPLLSWVENWCRVHPTARFGGGVVALAENRYANRQRTAP